MANDRPELRQRVVELVGPVDGAIFGMNLDFKNPVFSLELEVLLEAL